MIACQTQLWTDRFIDLIIVSNLINHNVGPLLHCLLKTHYMDIWEYSASVGHYLMRDKEWERLGMWVGTELYYIARSRAGDNTRQNNWSCVQQARQVQLGDGGEGSTSVLTRSERSNVALPCHLLVGPLLPGVSSSLLSPCVSGSRNWLAGSLAGELRLEYWNTGTLELVLEHSTLGHWSGDQCSGGWSHQSPETWDKTGTLTGTLNTETLEISAVEE